MSVGTLRTILRNTKHIWGTLIGVTIATMLFAMQGLGPALLIGVIAAGFAALLGSTIFPNSVKAGLIAGLIGVIFMLTYGVNKPAIALLSGLTSGLGAGLIVSQRAPQTNPVKGAINGIIAGLIAGGITVLMLVAVWLKIAAAAGHDPLEFLAILQKTVPGATTITNDVTIIALLSFYTLLAAALFGAVTGAVRALEGTPGRIGLLVVLGTVVLLMPLINSMTKLQILSELIPVYVFVLLALGLNIVVGYAGLLDLGYAAFFGIGAYTVGILSSRQFEPQIGFSMNFWLVIWVAAGVAAIAGVILGAPTLPLRGDYLAIVTLGFGEILPIMLRNLGGGGSTGTVMFEFFGMNLFDEPRNLTGGNSGITAINPPKLCEFEGCPVFSSQNLQNWYFLIVLLMVVTIFFINRLRESRQGRAWTAIREDELAADAMGINTVKTKLLAFAMGAMFSGFAGAFYGSYVGSISPDSFKFDVSVIVLCMVILGGLGSMTGVIVGGLLIMGAERMFLPEAAKVVRSLAQVQTGSFDIPAFRDPSQLKQLLFGFVLVVMMLVRPEGLLPNPERRAEFHEDDDTIDRENSELYDAERDPQLAGH